MPQKNDMKYSERRNAVLIVTAAEQFESMVKRSLKGFITIDTRRSIATARRGTLEKYYDLVVINTPLPDETGEEFALDITERCNASVLLVAPQEVYDDVLDRLVDYGIFVLPKPFVRARIDRAIRFLVAVQKRFGQLEKKTLTVEEKMEEIRVISRAKLLLVEKKHLSEDDAHRYIGRLAMNNGLSRRAVAERILEQAKQKK